MPMPRPFWQAIVSPGIAAIPLMTLLSWYNAAKLKEIPRNWGEVCGPYSAMALSLRRIRWQMISLAVFRDHKGEEHNIGAIGPRMFASLLKGVWKHSQAEKAAAQIRTRQIEKEKQGEHDEPGEEHRQEKVSTFSPDCAPLDLYHVKSLLHSKCEGEDVFSPLQKSCLQHVVAGGSLDSNQTP